MAKRMLIDSTHPEETRVAVISGNRLEEFDFESARKKQIKGNVYLAKVTRVEPSLQACFVEYGGNRHGFLAFNEIHPDYYRIPVADREALNRMVAEAMAAQEDDEEEERRPRWRRRGGRRRSGDSDEYQASPAAEEPAVAPDNGASGAGDEPLPDQPTAFEDDRRDEPAALAMPPAERTSGPALDAADAPVAEPARDERAAPDFSAEPPPEAAGSGYSGPPADYSGEPEPYPPPAEGYSGPPAGDAPGTDYSGPPLESPSYEPAGAPPSEEARTVEDEPSGPPAEPVAGEPAEARPADETVETVGGDEVEDIRRRHRIWQRRYKIQEVIRKRQILLVQVAKEERGNKGAALTTYISLAGRYCVLMPNTPRGGGISRKITSQADRKRLKEIVGELEVPDGMAVIVRTAGMERSKPELRRDLDFLLKTWEEIREKALSSTAPALIYEEANLIKRAVRDLYTKDVDEIVVDGEEGFEAARSFMKLLMPNHLKKVVQYTDKQIPLFHRYQVESQIDNMHSPSVQLRSGGYIVLNPTEALVAIDVNSGRATRERNIEETATRTNLEAADEIARQLRLRDLAGLIVIDFIDMEEGRNRHAVERRLKEALRHDRARIQVGRISPFGLLEMSRQRLRPSLVEASMMQCPHCLGAGYVRSTESMALTVLRAVEEEGLRQRSAEVTVAVPTAVALYIFNQKRAALAEIEQRHDFRVVFQPEETMGLSTYRIVRSVPKEAGARLERTPPAAEPAAPERAPAADHAVERLSDEPDGAPPGEQPVGAAAEAIEERADDDGEGGEAEASAGQGREGESREGERGGASGERRGRRRGRRGGRRRRGRHREGEPGGERYEPPRESTLGPFGEESAAAAEYGSPEDRLERAGAYPAEEPRREPDQAGNGAGPAAEEASPTAHVPPPAQPPLAEPAVLASEPERSAGPEPRTEPAAPAPAPPPAEPASPPASQEPPAPPRRGWWNLRR